MGKALYRKYRSRSLDEIVGQEHVTSILKNAIKRDRIGHAYLFTGPRGVGKTSIARILAHEINKLPYSEESSHLDIIEIDAASNNGVDDIRDLREKVALAPSSAAKKIYIIDEVHMLSKPAFNALLKTLEEPPEHVVFILATTDVDKLPDTIISRTQRYTFKLASSQDLIKNLKRIAKAESIAIDDAALSLIAEHSTGSYRDSVSLLDQLAAISVDGISVKDIENALGLAPDDAIKSLLEYICDKNFTHAISSLQQLFTQGIQPSIIATQLIRTIQDAADTYDSLFSLIDKLILVRQSAMPEALLIATIGVASSRSEQKSVVAKAVVAAKPASIEIPSLVKKATQAHPKDMVPSAVTLPEKKPQQAVATPLPSAKNFLNWNEIFSHTDALSIGLKTVLKKCSFADDGNNTLIIYAHNEFYKKKLDTAKYRQELSDLISTKTPVDWNLTMIPQQAPLKNQTVANVAAIMGGGEEVSVES